MAVIERLYVELVGDSTQLLGDFRAASRAAQRMGQDMQAVGRTLSAAVTLPLVGVGAAAIKMASDAEEAANKFNVVMGDAADDTRARLEELTATIPLTRSEMEKMAAGIQDMLVPMGLARDEAAAMSADMVELAGDLGSFNNVGTDQVLEAIQSALAGSSEPMRRFGVDTRETRLQAIALEQGLVSQGEALDNTTRALAVMAAIQADSTDAMGDAARTVDSTANSFRFLARDVKDIAIQIGQVLIPIIQPLVAQLRDAVAWVKSLSDEQRRAVVVFGLVAAAIGPVTIALGLLVSAIGSLGVAIAGLNAALGPAGWLLLGLGAAAAALFAFQKRAQDATTPLQRYQEALRGLTREALLHEQAITTIQFFDAKEAGASVEVLDQLIRKSVAIADAFGRLETPVQQFRAGMEGVRDAAEATERAVSNLSIPDVAQRDAPTNAGVVAGPLGQIPEALDAINASAVDLQEGVDAAADGMDNSRRAAGLLGRAASGLSQELGGLASAFASGGVVGAMIAGISSIFSSAEQQARRIEAARQNFERVLDAYVDELADMSRIERLQFDAVEGAKGALLALTQGLTAGIKSDKLRGQLEAAFADAIESLDLGQLQELLGQFGPEGAAILAEFKRRLIEIKQLREEEAEAAEEAARLAKEAAEALAAATAATIRDIRRGLERTDLELSGDNRGLFVFDAMADAERAIERIRELFEDGLISEDVFSELTDTINRQALEAIDQYDAALRASAAAALEAARAEEFRAMIDMENLRIRGLVANGLEDEAFVARQQIEVLQAIEQGRSAEYIALLKTIQAQEAANRAAKQQTDALNQQAAAADDATRAIDGMLRVIGGPAGLTERLGEYRNRALRYGGPANFGVTSPDFTGGGTTVNNGDTVFNVTINAAPGQDGGELYEQFKTQFQRDRQLGGVNPFGGL